MIAVLRRWLRLRRLDRLLARADKDLHVALIYRRNIGDAIDELRMLIVELEQERAIAAAGVESSFHAQPSGLVERFRTWAL